MASGNEVLGSAVRLYAHASYYTIDCETDLTLTETQTTVDIDSKCDAGKTVLKGVKYQYAFSFSGILQAGDSGTEAIRDSIATLTSLPCKIKTINSEMLSGTAYFTERSISAPNNDVCKMTASGTFTGTVAWGAAS